MKRHWDRKTLIITMLSISFIVYAVHFLIFRDIQHIWKFALHELAFVPIEVLLVSLVFDRMVERAHYEENLTKRSMLSNIFFSESGGDLLRYFLSCDPSAASLKASLQFSKDWTPDDFKHAKAFLGTYNFELPTDKIDFFGLHYHLSTRHSYFLKVIENPALVENSDFTELILELYSIWEELNTLPNLRELPEPDRQRLIPSIARAYYLLADEWTDDMFYLQQNHPARLMASLRISPFTF